MSDLFNVLLITISVMWSTGCFGIPLWASWFMWRDEEFGLSVVTLLIGFPVGVVLAALPWLFMADQASPDLATLKKNEWFCQQSHTQIITTYVKSGNAMVPVVSSVKVCDQYNRRS